jgi:hypothetical protein
MPGLDQQVDGLADQVRVQGLAGAVEGGDGTAEDFLCVGFGVVVGLYRAADVRGAAGQALGQLQLEFRVAADAERAAEAVHGRFADRGGLGQRGDAEAGRLLWVEQDDLGDFTFGLVQIFKATLDLFQEVSHAVHICSLDRLCK